MNAPAKIQSQKAVGLPRRLRPGPRSFTARAIPPKAGIQRARLSVRASSGILQSADRDIFA